MHHTINAPQIGGIDVREIAVTPHWFGRQRDSGRCTAPPQRDDVVSCTGSVRQEGATSETSSTAVEKKSSNFGMAIAPAAMKEQAQIGETLC